jgi:hypothetical protein
MKDRMKKFARDHEVAISFAVAAVGTTVALIGIAKLIDMREIESADVYTHAEDGVNSLVLHRKNGSVQYLRNYPTE